jgi:hypothetical protein
VVAEPALHLDGVAPRREEPGRASVAEGMKSNPRYPGLLGRRMGGPGGGRSPGAAARRWSPGRRGHRPRATPLPCAVPATRGRVHNRSGPNACRSGSWAGRSDPANRRGGRGRAGSSRQAADRASAARTPPRYAGRSPRAGGRRSTMTSGRRAGRRPTIVGAALGVGFNGHLGHTTARTGYFMHRERVLDEGASPQPKQPER